jgi:glycosyltransferase involved in cell wall biosynthesis
MPGTPRSTSKSVTAPDISVVVPVFEEEESLPELAERISQVCDGSGLTFEVFFVDDGSADTSWDVIGTIHAADSRFNGIRLRRNYGKSAALATGFEAAKGTYVVTLDADLQDDPAEIPELIQILRDGADLVSGWKKKRNDPISKTIPSRFFNFVTRALTRIPLHDFNCGLKAYRLEVVKHIHIYGELHRYIPVLARWEGYLKIEEKVVLHHARKFGRTKFGFERYLRGFLDLLSVFFLTRFAARPMHFFGTLGTVAFAGGFALSLWIAIDKIVYGNPIGDRPLLLLGVLLILVGVQMFTTGLVGEMIVVDRMKQPKTFDVIDSHQSGSINSDVTQQVTGADVRL